jgi:predicted regulator of amino acid metabolism with ACT domain
VHQAFIHASQNKEIARQTPGTGNTSFISPAQIIGTEKNTVTSTVSKILSNNMIVANNLDMIFFQLMNGHSLRHVQQSGDLNRNSVEALSMTG